ncbi:PAS domain S-box-containing protein [Lutibacter oricola]|uniref:histidine kinase n=1 Tax=Lutibacter oricola TaxID=762486 RepID=A0A1H3F6X3_9FLAO|nr:PAS domain-containing sensor histidine kinase [Lutibacter oricola]SDX86773.1 PAS domain S-box-containing protein [Lutibacter oricola]
MNHKSTYNNVLENQIAELKKQIEYLQLNSTDKSDTKNDQTNKIILAKEDAEEVKERLDFVLLGSNLGYWDWNIETNEVKRNKRWAEMLGYTFEEISSSVNQWVDFIHSDDREKAWASIKNHLDGITPFHQLEYRMLTKTGEVKWILDSAKIVKRDKKGNALRMSGTHLDITERKKTEQLLIESNATKDKFFSIIAHDLRSPFNNIIGFTELLIENSKEFKDSKFEKYLNIINSTAKHTHVLLDNLLNWAQSETGQIYFNPEKLTLSTIIKEVLTLSDSFAQKKDIVLNYHESERIIVFADLNMILTILRNLISNAIKFTNSHGKVNVYALTVDKFIEISVSDNGIGIDDETQKKLFCLASNISSHGTANEKGTGIGLILCKDFVEKHGGKIWVESKLGKGSTFKFKLPLKN